MPSKLFQFITKFLVIFTTLITMIGFSQSIPASNGSGNCGNCAPPGWVDVTDTPDVSNRTTVAGTGAGVGENDTW